MHQTKKGNQGHFEMKCHTAVDVGSGFVHAVEAASANVHDVTVAARLLREDDEVVYGDSAYPGQSRRLSISGIGFCALLMPIRRKMRYGSAANPRFSIISSFIPLVPYWIAFNQGFLKLRIMDCVTLSMLDLENDCHIFSYSI